ncbi:MAG TPA: type II toxin-antitoxin system HicB family antitoxin [Longimicrobium sp.]|jgi:predicted RNase H-like HicB family nuclease|uniref:type II toxin-antitoxin system HicB family antitoxin n=1 Tax=Longimicrobium sp. TaxID=2029185 RepID=UPI002ED9E996
MEYAVIIEPTSTGFSAYLPDVPGCVAAADTETEVKQLILEALQLHLEELRLDGEPIPQPTSRIAYVEVTEPIRQVA